MVTWLRVTLDTTPPKLSIYLPSVTTFESYEEISIVSNEFLDSSKHEIYVIDSLGVRHNFTFVLLQDKKTLFGKISFHSFPKGVSTLFAQVHDEVWNKSSLYSKSFNIIDPQNVKMFLSEYIGQLEVEIFSRKVITSEKESVLIFSEKIMPISISDILEEGDN